MTLSAQQWEGVLSDASPATFGEVVRVLEESDIVEADPVALVEGALANGPLAEAGDGHFAELTLVDDEGAEDGDEDTQTTASNPGCEPEDTGSTDPESVETDAQAAFEGVIEYWHNQLDRTIREHTDEGAHPERPTTAREYFNDVRGWDDATLDDLRLGWAPANGNGVLDHLIREGFTREDILATGLFTDDLMPLWQGRYVLPYYDAEGRVAYAIARCTGDKGGGAAGYDGHSEDYLAGKYAKVKHTDERVPFDEPIWGLDTLEEDEPVVVAEGVADAITAYEAGYSVLSPVTTEFKREHIAPLREAVVEHAVPRVYIVPDGERAAFAVPDDAPEDEVDSIGDVLDMPAVSPGLGGALRSATLLDDALGEAEEVETSVEVVHLPRAGLDKVDLDDYLHEWADGLGAVLRTAEPAEEYVEFDAAVRNMSASGRSTAGDSGRARGAFADDRIAERDGEEPEIAPEDPNVSSLWALDMVDVTPPEFSSAGNRGRNPAKHKGNSESYFVLREGRSGDLVATDYKGDGGKAKYNALTYLLVEADKRDRDAPEGPLSAREVWVAWKHAREEEYLPLARRESGSTAPVRRLDDGEDAEVLPDPIPLRALEHVAREHGLADLEDDEDRLPTEAHNQALATVREEYGLDPGRDPADRQSEESDGEYRTDPRDVDVVLDPGRAWDAAGLVEPADLPDESGLDGEGERFACPDCGEAVDVVRAVAVTHGLVDSCDADLGEVYADAYRLAREEHGAPLPRDLTTADAVAEFDAVLDAIAELGFFHLDTDALESDVTGSGDEVAGEAVRTLNPAWRDSESGESVLVFPSGTVWDAETEGVVDMLRFVALDSGLIDAPGDALRGEDFTEAYGRARDSYGAPLPRWDAALDGSRDVTPMLPPTEDLIDEPEAVAVDRDELTEVREDVERVVREAARERGTPSLVRCLPATGKTTAAIKTAGERPATYLAPRKELQTQALRKAEEWGASAEVLPVFADRQVHADTLADAVAHVREHGKDRLRDVWAIIAGVDGEGAVFEDEDDGDTADLARPTCTTADGEHGEAWALAVHVARELGYTPQQIHTRARALFGAPLPCEDDTEDGCQYSAGWDRVADPDDPADLLVGSYVHFHVESARTYYERGENGTRKRSSRAVFLDEYPGLDAYSTTFGEEAEDHAAWLGRALREDVEDRRDLSDRDLWGDEWVRAWLDGDADDRLDEVGEAADALERRATLAEAVTNAEEILAEVDRDALDVFDLWNPLRDVVDGERPEELVGVLERRLDGARPSDGPYGIVSWVRGAVFDRLTEAYGERSVDLSALPGGGELHALVERALAASEEREDGAAGVCAAAADALRGGDAGARELAVWADDGYAHPDAHHLLRAIVTPDESDGVTVVETSSFALDPEATDGTRLNRVATGDRATVLLDRNGHGAILHKPPSRACGSGDAVPVVGLDATGRGRLWSLALGVEGMEVKDVHDSLAERARFLRDTLGLQVVRCSDEARPYEGDPNGKDLDGDVALIEQIADEHTGVKAPRERGAEAEAIGSPAVITTKGVKTVLEEDDRLDGKVAAWENYGNLTGSNDLGNHRLATLLGSQHYGDDAVERMAALAGEEADTSRATGRGAALDYGSDVANTYLKHMREDQVMQAALRFSRGDSGATVFARTSALREDLPVVGAGQVVESYTDTATAIASEWRRLGAEFTATDVEDVVDVSRRQVQRVLAEFVEAGYLTREDGEPGTAHTYTPTSQPGAGEVDLPGEVRPEAGPPRQEPHSVSYTWNVGVRALETGVSTPSTPSTGDLPAPGTAPERATALGPPPG